MQMNRQRFNSDDDDGFKFESKKGVKRDEERYYAWFVAGVY